MRTLSIPSVFVVTWVLVPAVQAQTADAGPPFGPLPIVDEMDCSAAGTHDFVEDPAGASRVEEVLGHPCRILPPGDDARYMAWTIGRGKGLVPGQAYLLTVEYPEDEPRSMFVLNRGCETTRGFHTGATIGDVAVGYTDNALESLRVPLSGSYETWQMLFYLHDRFPGITVPRGAGPRPHLPADGFRVIIAQLPHKQAPRSAGAAVSRIRLFAVPDPRRFDLPLRLPPDGLPRRHIFWREEMSDGVIQSREPGERGVADDVDWYEYKARLMKFLGVNTFCKDLLEFGHNQGWDSGIYGGNDWVYQSSSPDRWRRILEMLGRYDLDVLPYYEYAGSVGSHGLGSEKRCMTLAGTHNYTNISWCERANADVTDPDTLADAIKVLDATITRHKDKVRFVGAWFRTRPSHMPISFADRCLRDFAADTGRSEAPTRELLRQDEELREDYYDWWFGKRRDFLVALRDHLRAEVDPDAVILFTPDPTEPGPALVANHRVVTTDDPDWWNPVLKELWGWTISARHYDSVLAEGLPLQAVLRPRSDWQQWEYRHSSPEPDPRRYKETDGVLLTYPFNRAYTTSLPDPFDLFRGPSGLAIVRHYSLNENTMEDKVGYFVSDVERAGPYCMLAEARAVAYGDPRYIGYLSAASFNRGFPQYVRAFDAAFLALPALPSERLAGACESPDVEVRAIGTPEHGTWLAVVNTGLEARHGVRITLPAPGAIEDAVSGEALETHEGAVTVDLGPCELRALHIR